MSHCGFAPGGQPNFLVFHTWQAGDGGICCRGLPEFDLAVTFLKALKYFAPEAGAEARLQGTQNLVCSLSIFVGIFPLLD